MTINFKNALAVTEQQEITVEFECEDIEVLETAMEAISQGRNIRYNNLRYRCGWVIRDLEDNSYVFRGYLSQALILQMCGIDM